MKTWVLTKIICFNRHLCQLLTAEDIFKSFSQIIVDEPDVGFACKIVQTLNTILLTSTELFELRTQLKNLETQVWIKGGYMLYASVLLKYVFQGGGGGIFFFYYFFKKKGGGGGGCYLRTFKKQQKNQIIKHVLGQMFWILIPVGIIE